MVTPFNLTRPANQQKRGITADTNSANLKTARHWLSS
jgi:selenocysteine-specific translation elongation factor